jgi:hypothetical protein
MLKWLSHLIHRWQRRSHVILVGLEVDGGANGTARVPPSYSYRLVDLVTGTVIRSKTTPLKPRQIGRFIPGSLGLAIDLYGGIELWDACETAEIATFEAEPVEDDQVGNGGWRQR